MGCTQEISSFNPVPCQYDFFEIYRADEVRKFNTGRNSYIGGAIEELNKIPNLECIYTYHAEGSASGPLEHSAFLKIVEEFLEPIKKYSDNVDGAYISLHGAMGTTEELDPEGYLLEEVRKILGNKIPIVISLDLHGVLTSKMLENVNGVASLHTYPHVDFSDTGRRAAKMLKKIIIDGVTPVAARVKIPAIVRGNELITETGLFGEQIRYAKSISSDKEVLSAGFLISNPFTDVPELCSQSYVFTDGDRNLASTSALRMATDFWPNRSKLQGNFVSLTKSVSLGSTMKGPIAFTDAADAPSSGAPGDSNAILVEMVKQSYPHSVLGSVVDPKAVEIANENEIGDQVKISVGGLLDSRHSPLELDWEIISTSNSPFILERWAFKQDPGPSAVLKSGSITLVVMTNPVIQVDRSVYFANGLDPRDFHSTIVKSPHCEPEFYDDWVEENFNVDAPGSTSANLPTLGHVNCERPMYPLDLDADFNPVVEFFSR